MNTTKRTKQSDAHGAGPELVEPVNAHTPRKLTFAENVILTVKVLTGFGLLGGTLWAINLWTEAR